MENKANEKIILAGNANVGKSVIFNRLTGSYAVVSNYPGTTVDISRGSAIINGVSVEVIDTPGTASLIPDSEDEQVTRDILLNETQYTVVQVADAKNLNRALLLTLELAELGKPMVLVLNMSDEARERGISINLSRLEKLLGIPVVATVGVSGEGIAELKRRIGQAAIPSVTVPYARELELLINDTMQAAGTVAAPRLLAMMLLSGDESAYRFVPGPSYDATRRSVSSSLERYAGNPKFSFFDYRNATASEIAAQVMTVASVSGRGIWAWLGQVSLLPVPGFIIALIVLWLMYEFVGVFGAGYLVDLLEHRFFGELVNPWLTTVVTHTIPWAHARDFLVGRFGLLTMACTYALAIVLPIVATFFFMFGLLEDSGYLPRLSAIMDRVFRLIGLNGKAVLPMILGLGCGTMATLSTRILETKKERLLVIILLALGIPCSAQLGVTLGMLSGMSLAAALIWLAGTMASLMMVGLVANRIIPGSQSCFIIEIPPLRRPLIGNVLVKIKMRLIWYLQEAVPLFILGTAILFVLDSFGTLSILERHAAPLITGVLGLPAETTGSFIMGFLRRDYGSAGLYLMAKQGILSPRQMLVSIMVITLFVPCVAQFFMMVKERGWKIAGLILLFVTTYAFAFGGILNMVLSMTGW